MTQILTRIGRSMTLPQLPREIRKTKMSKWRLRCWTKGHNIYPEKAKPRQAWLARFKISPQRIPKSKACRKSAGAEAVLASAASASRTTANVFWRVWNASKAASVTNAKISTKAKANPKPRSKHSKISRKGTPRYTKKFIRRTEAGVRPTCSI